MGTDRELRKIWCIVDQYSMEKKKLKKEILNNQNFHFVY